MQGAMYLSIARNLPLVADKNNARELGMRGENIKVNSRSY